MTASFTIQGAAALSAAGNLLALEEKRLEAELDATAHLLADRGAVALAHATPRAPDSPDRGSAPHAAELWRVLSGPAGPKSYGIVNDALSPSGEEYVPFLFTGTAAHLIEPLHAQALHFLYAGSDVFAHSVQHPGTLPTWPLVDALTDIAEEADRALALLGDQTVARVASEIAGVIR